MTRPPEDSPPVAPELSSLGVTQLIEALSSDRPLPAGGSAAALAAAAGAALLIKVATLPVKRLDAGAAAERTAEAERLRPLRDRLIQLIDRDAEAYGQVLAAFRMPRETDADVSQRRSAITAAMREATDVPLEMMRVSREALRSAASIAAHGPAAAAADVAIAVELLQAAIRSGGGGVDSNLPALKDASYTGATRNERERLDAESTEEAARARTVIDRRAHQTP